MDNYKGLYYKETKEQKFYEGGAHFPYEELYEILVYLKEEQEKKQKEELKELNKTKQNNQNPPMKDDRSNTYIYDFIQNHNINNANKIKTRTRNVMNSCFYNNPNTLIKKNVEKNKNQQINIGLSFNEKRDQSKSRNYKNDYALFYNKTSNQINRDDKNFLQEANISGIKTRNNLSNYLQKKYIGKNNSTNQIKHKKINLNNYLYSNIHHKEFTRNNNNITDKNIRNDSYIINNSKKLNIYNNFEYSKTKNLNNSNNLSKGRKINSSINKINNININNFINNNEHANRRQRNFSGLNNQLSHNINNYINVNINNHNNINVNINNVSYKKNINHRNKNNSLNGILMTLNKSNNRKYSNKKTKEKDDKKGEEFIFDYIKINKSRNINKKSALGHVKSMDYNNKPLTIELIGIENNNFYDQTFCNNNNDINKKTKMNINNTFKINMPKQLNKFGMNYSYMKMKKDSIKKNNIVFKPVQKGKGGIISNEIIKKYNLRTNYNKINNNTNNKLKNDIITHKVNINKNNVINLGKYNMINIKKNNNNDIWSKYYGYFKKLNKK